MKNYTVLIISCMLLMANNRLCAMESSSSLLGDESGTKSPTPSIEVTSPDASPCSSRSPSPSPKPHRHSRKHSSANASSSSTSNPDYIKEQAKKLALKVQQESYEKGKQEAIDAFIAHIFSPGFVTDEQVRKAIREVRDKCEANVLSQLEDSGGITVPSIDAYKKEQENAIVALKTQLQKRDEYTKEQERTTVALKTQIQKRTAVSACAGAALLGGTLLLLKHRRA